MLLQRRLCARPGSFRSPPRRGRRRGRRRGGSGPPRSRRSCRSRQARERGSRRSRPGSPPASARRRRPGRCRRESGSGAGALASWRGRPPRGRPAPPGQAPGLISSTVNARLLSAAAQVSSCTVGSVTPAQGRSHVCRGGGVESAWTVRISSSAPARTTAPPGCIPPRATRRDRRSWSWPTGSPGRGATAWGRSRSASPRRGSRRSSSTTAASATAAASRTSSTRAPARGLAGGDRLRPLAAGHRPRAGRDLRLLDGRRQRARRRGRGPAGRGGDQPGAVPRHAPPGAPLLAAGRRADAARRGPRRSTCPRSAQPRRGGLHQRPGRRGGLAPRGRGRRGLALAQPRLRRWLLGASLPPRPPRRRPALPLAASASARPTGSPSRARRSRRRGGRRWASCAPTPASTTSTSTTAPSSRRSSPTRSTSCGATSWRRSRA